MIRPFGWLRGGFGERRSASGDRLACFARISGPAPARSWNPSVALATKAIPNLRHLGSVTRTEPASRHRPASLTSRFDIALPRSGAVSTLR